MRGNDESRILLDDMIYASLLDRFTIRIVVDDNAGGRDGRGDKSRPEPFEHPDFLAGHPHVSDQFPVMRGNNCDFVGLHGCVTSSRLLLRMVMLGV